MKPSMVQSIESTTIEKDEPSYIRILISISIVIKEQNANAKMMVTVDTLIGKRWRSEILSK